MAGVPKDGGHILPWVGTVINCQLLSVLRCQWGGKGEGGGGSTLPTSCHGSNNSLFLHVLMSYN